MTGAVHRDITDQQTAVDLGTKLRIVWVAHSSGHMGAERVMLEAVKALSKVGVDCLLVLPWKSPIAKAWQELDVPRVIAPVTWWSLPGRLTIARRLQVVVRFMLSALVLTGRIRTFRPDLVVSNTSVTPSAALAAKLLGIPHIWYIHEFGLEDHGLNFALGRSLSVRAIGMLSDRVIVNSRAVEAHFADILPEKKTRVLHCAVEVPVASNWQPPEGRTFKLIIVGRLSPNKRQEDAIRAVSILLRKGLAVHLTIVGPGDPTYSAYLRQLTGKLGVESAISFFGDTDSPLYYVASAQVALICSRSEAFGRVTVEAMKMGKPVIGSRSGGTVEIIKDGFNGFLYNPGDPVDLALKIETVIDDSALRHAMGRNARSWASETFDVQKYTKNLLTIMHEAIDAYIEVPDERQRHA